MERHWQDLGVTSWWIWGRHNDTYVLEWNSPFYILPKKTFLNLEQKERGHWIQRPRKAFERSTTHTEILIRIRGQSDLKGGVLESFEADSNSLKVKSGSCHLIGNSLFYSRNIMLLNVPVLASSLLLQKYMVQYWEMAYDWQQTLWCWFPGSHEYMSRYTVPIEWKSSTYCSFKISLWTNTSIVPLSEFVFRSSLSKALYLALDSIINLTQHPQ